VFLLHEAELKISKECNVVGVKNKQIAHLTIKEDPKSRETHPLNPGLVLNTLDKKILSNTTYAFLYVHKGSTRIYYKDIKTNGNRDWLCSKILIAIG
jgi:hypothetical protein